MEAAETDHHDTEKGWKKKGKNILIGVFAFLLVFFAFGGVLRKNREKSKSAELKEKTSEIKPYVPPMTFDITGETPDEFENLPIGYNYTFVCGQPYKITDANGNTYEGEANKDVSIGIDESTESTAKSRLKFNTRNNTNSVMVVHFNPIK